MLPPIQNRSTSSVDQILPVHQTGESSRSAAVSGVTVPADGAVIHRPSSPMLRVGHFPPSAELKADARELAEKLSKNKDQLPTNIAEAADRMILEGRYLQEHKGSPLSFNDVSTNLGLQSSVAKEVHEGREVLINSLLKTLAKPQPSQMAELTDTLRNAMHQQTRLLGGRVAMYDEVITRAKLDKSDERFIDLSPAQLKHIERSERAFADYAAELSAEVPTLLELLNEKASAIANALKAVAQDPSLAEPEAIKQWENTAKQIGDLKVEMGKDFTNAVSRAGLTKTLEHYEKIRTETGSFAKAYIGGAGPQIAASVETFGLARGIAENNIDHVAGKIAGAAALMTGAHEGGVNFVRPGLSNMMHTWAVVPLDTTKMVPNANPRISEDGVTRPLNKEEAEAAQKVVKDDRAAHAIAKANHKPGTFLGNVEFIASFATAQLLAKGLSIYTGSDPQSLGARSLASGMGGMSAGGLSAALSFKSTSKDFRGRDIPTHTFDTGDKTRNQKFQATAANAAKLLDVSNTDVRRTYASKAGGFATGLTASAGLQALSDMMDPKTMAGQFGQVTFAALGPPALLISAFGSFSVNAEAKANQKVEAEERKKQGLDKVTPGLVDKSRLEVAWKNMSQPGRAEANHGIQPDSKTMRFIENTDRRITGVGQGISQLVPDATSTAGNLLQAGYESAGRAYDAFARRAEAQAEAQAVQSQGETTATEGPEGIELTTRRRPHHDPSDKV